jgi:hypothetical protein
LQPHQATVFVSFKSTFNGANPEPLWEPSQCGWAFESPQAHHQYAPAAACKTNGDFCAM